MALRKVIVVLAMSAVGAACGHSSMPNPAAPTPSATITSITVTSAATGAATFQLAATARMSDGSALDVTQKAAWDSSNLLLATISPAGVVTIRSGGEVDLRATYNGTSGSMHLVVARVPILSVNITGGPNASASFQLTATARLSDGSTEDVTNVATWESSNIAAAIVSSTGLVRILGGGEVDIRAAYLGVTNSSHLFVTPPKTYVLTGIVSAASPSGQPITGAQVRILESSVSGSPTLTDANGAFTFAALGSGRHLVEVSKAGYDVWEGEVEVLDRDLQIVVTLALRIGH
jgi:hypothetical protein